jgi:hypothetical protein
LRGIAVRKNGVASLAYGDEAIQSESDANVTHLICALRARWIASLAMTTGGRFASPGNVLRERVTSPSARAVAPRP